MDGTAALFLVALLPVAAHAQLVVENDVPARMRDGVVLRADVWRPAASGRFPVLVYRTPYGKSAAAREYATFRRAVSRGYAVVMQDVRGRHASEGEFVPYRNEGRDGYDTIEWAAGEPWSNGAVGSFGLSYPGAVQWLAALTSPPHLKAMAPAMTFSTPDNFFHSGGVFDLSWIGWIWNNIAPDARVRKGLAGPRTVEAAEAAWPQLRERLLGTRPLTALAELKDVAPYYFDWLAHPPGDAWWEWCEVRGRYDRTRAAVLNLSGWHDEAYGPEGAITNFRGLVQTRQDWDDPRTRLVIGPWVHGVDAVGRTRSGERELGPAAALDYDALVLDFMDRHLRGIAGGEERRPRVRVFVMGEGVWREADTWPLPGTTERTLYLAPGGGRGALSWTVPGAAASASSFVSDPADPVTDPFATQPGAHDYRALAERPDVLVFDSEPLLEDLRVVGELSAEIFLATDAPDADLWLKLLDLAPDGTAWNLMSPGLDVLRASYRDGGPRRALLDPGTVYALRFPNLRTANLFKKGHRVRVVLAATFFPHFSRNLHTGELETTSAAMRKATVRIHHDRDHPSRFVLPVVAP